MVLAKESLIKYFCVECNIFIKSEYIDEFVNVTDE